MKLFNEYTVPELSKLSYLEIENLIKLECLSHNIPYMGVSDLKEPSALDFADDHYFFIENTGIVSRDKELLQTISESIKDSTHSFQPTNWSLEVGFDFPYLENEYSRMSYEVKIAKCFKRETVLNHGPSISAYKEAHKAYLKAKENRKETYPVYLEIRKTILDGYQNAIQKVTRARELNQMYEVFKKLAGSEDEAKKHFEKYYPGEFETVKGEENGREATF